MANRLILGKNINTNHGHSSGTPGYGLYISRPGKDVTTCTADELVFNTDNGSTGALSRIRGLFQLAPIDTSNNTSTTTTISAGSTATIDLSSVDFNFGFGLFGFGSTVLHTDSSASTGDTYNFDSTTSSISITNDGSSSITTQTIAVAKYSTLALF